MSMVKSHFSKHNISTSSPSSNYNELLKALSDFHLLLYLHDTQILSREDFALLTNLCKYRRHEDLLKLEQSGSWQTLLMIANESHSTASSSSTNAASSSTSSSSASKQHMDPWQCRHCTFVNMSGQNCSICGLPNE